MKLLEFAIFSIKQVTRGDGRYYLWLVFLAFLLLVGGSGFADQTLHGHIVTNMRDPVPWGVFIGTYAFFVGVAAAAVALAVPGYVYDWNPIKEIVVLGEIIAISAVVMSILFVISDLGHPERFWHLLPFLGKPNIPSSMIAMNVMILNGYLVLNLVIVTYFLYCGFAGHRYNRTFFMALMYTSIPAAISIHVTTAFIFNVLPSRPYWNSAILVPRFIATALCAGPALMILGFEVLRKVTHIGIKQEALLKIAEMTAIVLFVNLLLFIAEVVTEYRSATAHTIHMQYYFEGLGDHVELVGWAWTGAACNLVAFFLLLFPRTRKQLFTMNLGCVLVFVGVFIEKGIGLVLPGFTPSTLGEVYTYRPSLPEVEICVGIFGAGLLVFTVFTKVAIPIVFGQTNRYTPTAPQVEEGWADATPPTRWPSARSAE